MDDGPRVITTVYCFANGMTMVFDQDGKQMPEFQGPTEEVRGKIEATGYSMPTEALTWKSFEWWK